MTASTSYSAFHQWLLTDPATVTSACAIVLHVDPALPGAFMVEEIADYLNEYDDDGDGCWLPATEILIAKVCGDGNYRKLLGIAEKAGDDEGMLVTLGAIGQRGRVVFQAPEGDPPDLGSIKSFHAGVGLVQDSFESCHLVLNPRLIDHKCIAHIVGDVFLEWLHSGFKRGTSLHQIE